MEALTQGKSLDGQAAERPTEGLGGVTAATQEQCGLAQAVSNLEKRQKTVIHRGTVSQTECWGPHSACSFSLEICKRSLLFQYCRGRNRHKVCPVSGWRSRTEDLLQNGLTQNPLYELAHKRPVLRNMFLFFVLSF